MRAELLDVPCTWIVMPEEPAAERLCASCVLLSVSRTEPPVSTLPDEHPALVAKDTAYGSPPTTSTACTMARHRPGAPSMEASAPRAACWTPVGSMTVRLI